MAELSLYCHCCGKAERHTILPWQSEPGRFDWLSVGCRGCDRFKLLEIARGIDLDIGDDDQGKGGADG